MPETTRALLTAQAAAWQRILDHPFVSRTSAGSLPKATFDRWIAEDYFFVQSFERYLARLSRGGP